jgi:hypothetical protein
MTFTVDIHHYLIPGFYRAATEHDGQSVGGVLPARWSQVSALSLMDDAGIDVAIASISAAGSSSRRRRRRSRSRPPVQ